ncbi:11454_t:CDS:10 [Entrophospora sp. SA101]|nr:11454_t:CDS:10 [Entrophospora sp. SA101]
MKLDDEQPTIAITYSKGSLDDRDSLPAPVIYLSFETEFGIGCKFLYDRLNDNEGDCQKYVTQPVVSEYSNLTHGRPFRGKFAPKDLNLSRANDLGNPLFFLLDIGALPEDFNRTVMIQVFDSEFDPWADDFDQSRMTPFAESFDSMNLYVIPSGVSELLTYSRRIRKTLPESKSTLIGFRTPKYNEVKYLESEIQTINNSYAASFALVKVGVQDFNVVVEQEQRINSLVTVLGTISGYYSIIATFYILLFGAGSLSPWGIVHNGCWKFRRFKKETEDELKKEADKFASEVEKGGIDDAAKVKELEYAGHRDFIF